MSNLFSGIVGAIIGGSLVAGLVHLREKWQDELIDSVKDNDGPATPPIPDEIPVDEDQSKEETVDVEEEQKEASASSSVNLGFTDEDRARQRAVVERMVVESESRKELRAQIKAEREARKAREARGEVETPVEAPSSATYDPYTGIFKDGGFEVEYRVDENVTSEIPPGFEVEESDRVFYTRTFNKLVEKDRVIPFDRRWLDDDDRMTGLHHFDHRRHEKGFFAAVTEEEDLSAILHVTRKGVTAQRPKTSGEIEWATTRHDLDVRHQDQMGVKERNRIRRDWDQVDPSY